MSEPQRALLVMAVSQLGLITRNQALQFVCASTIKNRLAEGQWLPIFRGVYRLAGFPTTYDQQLLAGCLSIGPQAVASHRSAAALMSVPNQPRWVEVTVPRTRRLRTKELIAHSTLELPPTDVCVLRGVPATTAVRTLIDLAELPLYDHTRLGTILDYMAARSLVCRPELEAHADRLRGTFPHIARIDQLLADRPDRPDKGRPLGSDFEAMLLPPLRKAGLPVPEHQYRLVLPNGDEIFLDFAYPNWRLALEADSYLWHSSKEAWRRDRRRNNEVIAMGWSILPVTWDMVRYRAAETAQLVARALASRAA